jgi:hypothetical protein
LQQRSAYSQGGQPPHLRERAIILPGTNSAALERDWRQFEQFAVEHPDDDALGKDTRVQFAFSRP